jgi:hypothetical protein
MRRARRQLKGPVAITGAIAVLLAVAGCSGTADSMPAPAARGGLQAAGTPAMPLQAPTPTAAASGARPASQRVTEATCATAPLGARVVSVRRESPDSIRVELALANLAAADAWAPGSAIAAAAQAAVDALDQASVLSADGRRRMFALRGGAGEPVGSPAILPEPGRTETFWALFPAAEGEVSVLLPGFTPLAGLTVAPRPGQPEP